LRFGGEDGPATVDPTVKTENIGTDTLQATDLGLKNLDRVLDHLLSATTALGEDYSLLEETYKTILSHRRNWFAAVALNVGGVVENRTLGGRGNETFTRVSKDKQKAAVKFLNEHAFTTPARLLNPAILNRFKYTGVASDISGTQQFLMRSLLNNARIRRLMDDELLNPDKAYTVMELLNDVQNGIFSELNTEKPKIDVLRRGLQRAYLEHLRGELEPRKEDGGKVPLGPGGGLGGGGGGDSTDFRAVARAALKGLRGQIGTALNRAQDAITIAHLQDCE